MLLAGAAVLPRRRAWAAGSALCAWALGAGAFAAVPGITDVGLLAARLSAVGLSRTFVGVNVGALLLGAGGVGVAALLTASDHDETRTVRATGAVVSVAALVVLAIIIPLLSVGGLVAAAAAALAGAAAWGVVLVGRAARRALGRRSPAPHVTLTAVPRAPSLVAFAAAVTALAAPHVLAVLGAALVTAVAAHLAARRARSVPVVPVLPLSALALVPFGWLLVTIAGPSSLATRDLPLLPLSPPAQALVAPLLAAGAWGFLGLWPLHRWVPGPVLAPVGGALLLRIGVPGLAAGLEHLQPAFFAAGTLAAWHAALARRPAALIGALGFVATAAIVTGAHVAVDARVAAAVLFALAPLAAVRELYARALLPIDRIVATCAGAAAYAAILAGLRAEVFLTVLVIVACAAACWRLRGFELAD